MYHRVQSRIRYSVELSLMMFCLLWHTVSQQLLLWVQFHMCSAGTCLANTLWKQFSCVLEPEAQCLGVGGLCRLSYVIAMYSFVSAVFLT